MKKVLLISALFIGMIFSASAQVFSLKSSDNFASDTVTNTGTAYLSTALITSAPATTTTVWVAVTKISGTVGGTLTLQGSLDGTNWKGINQPNIQTAVTTITASDATATYHWIITGSPFQYYRVSWTGTGTMAASFTAKLFRSK